MADLTIGSGLIWMETETDTQGQRIRKADSVRIWYLYMMGLEHMIIKKKLYEYKTETIKDKDTRMFPLIETLWGSSYWGLHAFSVIFSFFCLGGLMPCSANFPLGSSWMDKTDPSRFSPANYSGWSNESQTGAVGSSVNPLKGPMHEKCVYCGVIWNWNMIQT